ncbi:MAG TPA: heparan-alpha-glucosaminide N-acetyltransferase [Gammaproteobacteria bacterium]
MPVGGRYREVDIARGVAVVLMVVFHFAWDLDHFGLVDADMLNGPWYWFGRLIGSLFIFILGLSMQLAVERKPAAFAFYMRRGAGLLALGAAVSLGTWFVLPDGYVVFGILSLLGVLCLLLYPLRRLPPLPLACAGIAMIAIGFPLNAVYTETPWLLWLGVLEQGRYMADWYPLLPWGGFGLLGIAAGKRIYGLGRPLLVPHVPAGIGERSLKFLGRHPLIIYLVHQPVLVAMFWLLGFRA